MEKDIALVIIILGLGLVSVLVALAYKRNPLLWFFWSSALPGLGLCLLLLLIVLEKTLRRNCDSYVEDCLLRSSCSCAYREGLEHKKTKEMWQILKAHVLGRKACLSDSPGNPYRDHPSASLRKAWEDGWNEARRFIENHAFPRHS